MGPFSRTKHGETGADADEAVEPSAQEVDIVDFDIGAPEYRRVGQALATVVVTIGSAAPLTPTQTRARMSVRSPDAAVVLDPVLVTHEAPGLEREQQRLWFLVDLSRLIFGDNTFALVVDGSEVALQAPQPRAPWVTGEGDETIAMDSAWSESELRAVVGALEERCRLAERSAADLRGILEADADASEYTSNLTNAWREVEELQELLDTRESAYRAVKEVLDAAASERDARDAQIKVLQAELERAQREAVNRDVALISEVERARERAADGRRMAQVVAGTLTQVQAERRALLEQAAEAVAERDQERAAREARLAEAQQAIDALNRKLRASASPPRRRRGLLAMLQSAAGAAGPSPDAIVEQQRATIADLEHRIETAEARAADSSQTDARTESELGAQLEEKQHELAVVYAALDEMRARFDAPPEPAPPEPDGDSASSASTALIARLGAAQGAALSADPS